MRVWVGRVEKEVTAEKSGSTAKHIHEDDHDHEHGHVHTEDCAPDCGHDHGSNQIFHPQACQSITALLNLFVYSVGLINMDLSIAFYDHT